MSDAHFDTDRLDEVILALLWANSFKEKFGGYRAWKSLPWDALDRLHAKGLIGDAHGRAQSVTLDDEAHARGQALFEQWFGLGAPASTESTTQARAKATAKGKPDTYQFKVILDGVKPPVWRRIQLPGDASFWDLHCAINDAMGWEDMHLHAFQIGDKRNSIDIGIPMEDDMPWSDATMLAGWDVPIANHLNQPGAHCTYLYDFGDDWSHKIVLEAIVPREAKIKYPRCLAGARACPPEDCGGVHGYARLCDILKDPGKTDEEAEELLDWLGSDFDPEAFDACKVKFGSAARRLKALRSSMH
jgi:hypothetical protein